MNILAFGAHPDDIEICCSGTLARYAKQGDKVFMAVATNGNKGCSDIEPQKMAAIRKSEAEKSAEIIGAELIWMDFEDEELQNNLQSRLVFVDAIRLSRPHVIFCPALNDYHIDHRITGELTFEAASVAFVNHVKTHNPSTENLPALYSMDTCGGIDFMPEEYVDITEELDTKLKMLSMHQSQVDYFIRNKTAGFDLPEEVRAVARFRGIASGVKYAEGFRKMHLWRRGLARRVLP